MMVVKVVNWELTLQKCGWRYSTAEVMVGGTRSLVKAHLNRQHIRTQLDLVASV